MNSSTGATKGSTTTVNSIVEKLPLTTKHYFIIAVAAIAFAFASFDTYIVAYAMPVVVKEWHLDQVTIGMLASAGFWGMLFGAMIWGPIADK